MHRAHDGDLSLVLLCCLDDEYISIMTVLLDYLIIRCCMSMRSGTLAILL
jgi:hypothetical protein